MSAQPEKRYFNVNEYYLMAQVGVLISLPKKLVEQHFEVGNGCYAKLRKRRLEDTIVSTSVPGLSLKVNDIFG